MLKVRIIPILTFNGFGLVKTKQFKNPRMVGNPVQAARVYNNRGVDELVFLDIFATVQKRKNNLKLVADVIKECYMPVAIGGGITSIDDINDLLKIGADKIVLKTSAITNKEFVKDAVSFFGSQCICVSVDVFVQNQIYYVQNNINKTILLTDFIEYLNYCQVGEIILNSVDNDGMMQGFDVNLVNFVFTKTKIPLVAVGGGGNIEHFVELFSKTSIKAVAASSIFHFTQFTPLDIKNSLNNIGIPVRF